MVFFDLNNRKYQRIEYGTTMGSFQDCKNLRYFEMPESITILGPYSFNSCS